MLLWRIYDVLTSEVRSLTYFFKIPSTYIFFLSLRFLRTCNIHKRCFAFVFGRCDRFEFIVSSVCLTL